MNRALAAASVALLMFAGAAGCGDDDDADPAVQTTPAATPAPTEDSSDSDASQAMTAKEVECKDEIVRQMKDKSQVTSDTPPQCQGIETDRIVELASIADDEIKAGK